MASELIINSRLHETRVALVENSDVAELYIERKTGQELIGNIYRGRVVRVLPGMQAAFVDIGHERTAFLYVTDVYRDVPDIDNMMPGEYQNGSDPGKGEAINAEYKKEQERQVNIEELLREGQDIMVQVAKEPLGTKGARLTSYISLPGRHLVLLPTVNHIGISRRIEDPEERERLKNLVRDIRTDESGFIVRTVSEGTDADKLKSEMDFMLKLWKDIKNRMANSTTPGLLYMDLSVTLRAVRDLFTREVDRLIIDDSNEYDKIMEFVDKFAPALKNSIELYSGDDPIFDVYGIEMEISRALDNVIWLKSGGYIIIEMTEALTSIDVNTGSYVGKRNLEETILKTNLEAVKELAYQLRLRNIGGLIVIDFIDMEKVENRQRVFTALTEALSKDKAKTNVLPMSELGLIEMTRKRTRENLGRFLTERCQYCEGRGVIKSKKTISYEIFRDLEREPPPVSESDDKVYVEVNPEIENVIKEDEQQSIMLLEKKIKRRIIILSRNDYHMEQYTIST
ncbi:MAG: Rne/Rng family ribonuclease [Deltaproteobacteria bacterium]|nr:Rne/Rng family ribonuclease [Deltaproteobacteria bacterium]